jgi:hypothetical protein
LVYDGVSTFGGTGGGNCCCCCFSLNVLRVISSCLFFLTLEVTGVGCGMMGKEKDDLFFWYSKLAWKEMELYRFTRTACERVFYHLS